MCKYSRDIYWKKKNYKRHIFKTVEWIAGCMFCVAAVVVVQYNGSFSIDLDLCKYGFLTLYDGLLRACSKLGNTYRVKYVLWNPKCNYL